MERKVRKQSDVLGALLALGELSEDQEAPKASTLAHANTLLTNCDVVEITLGNVAPLHHAQSPELFKSEVDKGRDDADGENPFRDLEVDLGFDFGGPPIEDEEVDGGEGVDAVDGNGDEQHEPEVKVCEWGAAALGLEVVQILGRIVSRATKDTFKGARKSRRALERGPGKGTWPEDECLQCSPISVLVGPRRPSSIDCNSPS